MFWSVPAEEFMEVRGDRINVRILLQAGIRLIQQLLKPGVPELFQTLLVELEVASGADGGTPASGESM